VIVDSSAVVAVLLREPGFEPILDRLSEESAAAIGAATLAETGIVLAAKLGVGGKSLLVRFVQEASLDTVPLGDEHWRVAIDAYLRFGKGRHPARLNFGDCLTYAVAQIAQEPLLYIGDDFTKTDIEPAL
jgi:ribonuclease VapC